MNIKIYNKNFDLTEPFQQYVQEKFDALDKYQENIISCSLDIKRDPHHHKGEIFEAEVHMILPNKQEIRVAEAHQDARAVVDMLQDKVSRAILKQKSKADGRLRKNIKILQALKFWDKNKS